MKKGISVRTMNLALGAIIWLALFSCASVNPATDPSAAYRQALQREVPPLSPAALAPETGLLAEYTAGFRARHEYPSSLRQYLGYLPSGDHRIFTQILVAEPASRGTAFVFHGFATDSSRYGALAAALLREGWTVVLADLPGHGLSTGIPGAAPDFSVYGQMVHRLQETLRAWLPAPYVAVGHSTGALALMDYSLRYEQGFSRYAFFAPLVRTAWWPVLGGARGLTRPWIHSLRTTSQTQLGVYRFPLDWFDGLVAWEHRARQVRDLRLPPTLVLLAARDGVIAGGYNSRFIRDRTPDCRVERVENSDHYELDSRRPEPPTVERIVTFLADSL